MTIKIKIVVIIVLTVLLQVSCNAGEVNLTKLNKADWILLETESFYIITDAAENDAVKIACELENFKYFLSRILNYKQKPITQKVQIVAVMNDDLFNSTGIPENYSGIYLNENNNVIFANCNSFRNSSKRNRIPGRSAILHEIVHWFIHNTPYGRDIPPWFDEGIAIYFSTYIKINGKVFWGNIGSGSNIYPSKLKNLKRYSIINTESLFKTTRLDLNVFNTSMSHKEYLEAFYARSFLVVKYMLSDPERTKMLNQYLSLLQKGASIDESFKYAFSISFLSLDRKVRYYLEGKSFRRESYLTEKTVMSFPEVKFVKHDLKKREAMKILITKISMLPENFLNGSSLKKNNKRTVR